MLAYIYKKMETTAWRMGSMMQRLDVDPFKIAHQEGGHGLRHARARCMSCQSTEVCDAYLTGKDTSADPMSFCPNHAMFADSRGK